VSLSFSLSVVVQAAGGGDTALTWASYGGYTAVVQLLLEHKDLNINQVRPPPRTEETALTRERQEG
jgi:hypothetical protein